MKSNFVSMGFLKTELETGITFANVALSAREESKVARNRANARKAYETAMRFAAKASLDADGSALLDPLFEKLRRQLVAVGRIRVTCSTILGALGSKVGTQVCDKLN